MLAPAVRHTYSTIPFPPPQLIPNGSRAANARLVINPQACMLARDRNTTANTDSPPHFQRTNVGQFGIRPTWEWFLRFSSPFHVLSSTGRRRACSACQGRRAWQTQEWYGIQPKKEREKITEIVTKKSVKCPSILIVRYTIWQVEIIFVGFWWIPHHRCRLLGGGGGHWFLTLLLLLRTVSVTTRNSIGFILSPRLGHSPDPSHRKRSRLHIFGSTQYASFGHCCTVLMSFCWSAVYLGQIISPPPPRKHCEKNP